MGRETQILAPSCGVISVKALKSKSQRMDMTCSRFPDVPFFFWRDVVLWSSQSFYHSLSPPARVRQRAAVLQEKMLGPEAPYLLLCLSIFVLPKTPSVIPSILHYGSWCWLQHRQPAIKERIQGSLNSTSVPLLCISHELALRLHRHFNRKSIGFMVLEEFRLPQNCPICWAWPVSSQVSSVQSSALQCWWT